METLRQICRRQSQFLWSQHRRLITAQRYSLDHPVLRRLQYAVSYASRQKIKALKRCYSSASTNNDDSQTLGKLPVDEGKLMMIFTCDICEERASRLVSKRAYQHGVVIVRCSGCDNLHLIADNLGWFGKGQQNIESILEEKGETVRRSWDQGGIELDPGDLALAEKCVEGLSAEKKVSSKLNKRDNT